MGVKTSLILVLLTMALTASAPIATGKKTTSQEFPAQHDEQRRALHAISRLTFGPRPGEVQRVLATGVDKWIDQQLHPEKINDSALDARLASFRTLRMSTREIVENFPPEAVIKAVEEGKQPLPSDPLRRAVYQDEMDRLQEQEQRKQDANLSTNEETGNSVKSSDSAGVERREETRDYDSGAEQLPKLPPEQRVKEILAMSPRRRRALASSFKGARSSDFLDGMTAQQREAVRALDNPQKVVVNELLESKILRSTYSERQLQEVMTDFWFNHFNVFIGKGADRYLLTSYERDVIRPQAMGKFEDLLIATAQSPAMLFYLDNWLSVGPNSDVANGVPKNSERQWRRRYRRHSVSVKQAKGRRSGLNENYGRELMELHTLGVNGGYTQKDVTEVARVFTGWTLKEPRQGGGFLFDPRMHEPGDKIVLGHRIKPGGEKEGLEVLHMLAHHPSTARFLCTQLAMRFVSDDPPSALVDQMAKTYQKKDGDIRDVLKTMFHSSEFWSTASYHAKLKTPLEFVVSAIRATNADITDAMPIAHHLQNLGMPLYGMQPPTGYSMKGETWVNSSALLGRMNFALALTAGGLKGIRVDCERLLPADPPTDAHQVVAELEESLLAGEVSKQTEEIIVAELDDPKISQHRLDDPVRLPNIGLLSGLILGSPEFQRR